MVACRMNLKEEHLPVMLAEVIENLSIQPNGKYIDATFGRGGHSQAILEKLNSEGRLLAIDKDPEAIIHATQCFGSDPRFAIEHGSFADLETILKKRQWYGELSGILFDLGVSSPQLDQAERGFSFMREGPLDMRMNSSQGINAAQWIAEVKEQELARVLWEYGEERFSRRVAHAIVEKRNEAPIVTTKELAEIISAAIPRWEKHKHPATRSFLAIRIAINRELEELEKGLIQSLDSLRVGGRLLVISFHSLEDRLVKRFIQHHERGGDFPAGLPLTSDMWHPRLRRLGRARKPSSQESAFNPRARSAILRVAEKLL